MTKPFGRRTVLAALGLAPASAVAMEDFIGPETRKEGPRTGYTAWAGDHFASALETMAREIRERTIDVVEMSLEAHLKPDEIAGIHTMSIKFMRLVPETDA